MESVFTESGLARSDWPLLTVFIQDAKRDLNCLQFSIVNALSDDEIVLRLHDFRHNQLNLRSQLIPFANTHTFREINLKCVRRIDGNEIEVTLRIGKQSSAKTSRLYYEPVDTPRQRIYFRDRFREATSDKNISMPRLLLQAIDSFLTELVHGSRYVFDLELDYVSGDTKCTIDCIGVNDSCLSFLVYLIERTGRFIVEITFAIEKLRVSFDTEYKDSSALISVLNSKRMRDN